jgi:hypothetical protein
MNRTAQIETLIHSLSDLTAILDLDPNCQWRSHFLSSSVMAEEVRLRSFSQDDLNELSGSVRHVFGGMGSFSDYCPLKQDMKTKSWHPIPGMERLTDVSNAVYESALQLMVVGKY